MTKMLENTKESILAGYEKKIMGWKKNSQPVAELRDLTAIDVMMLVMKLHPTDRKVSKEATKKLLQHLFIARVTTTADLSEATGLSYPALLERIKALRDMNIIRREKRVYYLATPRLDQFVKDHMERLG